MDRNRQRRSMTIRNLEMEKRQNIDRNWQDFQLIVLKYISIYIDKNKNKILLSEIFIHHEFFVPILSNFLRLISLNIGY